MNKSINSILFLLTIFLCQCNSNRRVLSSYTVVRSNIFDTTNFRLSSQDTNKFNISTLSKVFDVVKIGNESKCILTETVFDQAPSGDYYLYDQVAKKYFKMLGRDKTPSFREVTDSLSISLIDFVKDNLNSLESRAREPLPDAKYKHETAFYIINEIEMQDTVILIKSYYLKELNRTKDR